MALVLLAVFAVVALLGVVAMRGVRARRRQATAWSVVGGDPPGLPPH